MSGDQLLLVALGVVVVLAFFAVRPAGLFHSVMTVSFLGVTVVIVLGLFGVNLPEHESLSTIYFLGFTVPLLYFVMRGAVLFVGDVTRGVQKVNRHLNESHASRWSPVQEHHGRQYIYDHERNEWYVFVAHVEKWEPLRG